MGTGRQKKDPEIIRAVSLYQGYFAFMQALHNPFILLVIHSLWPKFLGVSLTGLVFITIVTRDVPVCWVIPIMFIDYVRTFD